ncbi:MAG: PASTA domain-containing protein [Bacteroidales bacterium]|jgi:beta-lactam-binding protein with PASTA domain|nr:PASTA domain-containing protein [Bacteroidales bacterium]
MTLFKYLSSKYFYKHLAYAIGGVTGLIIFIFLILKVYTHHGQALSVPDFKGLTIEEVHKKAKKSKMRIEVSDSVFNNNLPKGTVIEQNPIVGFKVKKNRRVFVTVNALNPEKVKMPNIVGVSHRQAEAVLKNAGLEIGRLIHIPDIAINNVLNQKFNGEEIKEGFMIPKGSKIDLVLGMGLSNQKTQIPDLDHYSLERAKTRILRSALNLGAVIYGESILTGEDSTEAKVWRQYPSFKENKLIRLGSTIDIWLTVDSTILYPEMQVELIDTLINNE